MTESDRRAFEYAARMEVVIHRHGALPRVDNELLDSRIEHGFLASLSQRAASGRTQGIGASGKPADSGMASQAACDPEDA